jgi:hypothetical protein
MHAWHKHISGNKKEAQSQHHDSVTPDFRPITPNGQRNHQLNRYVARSNHTDHNVVHLLRPPTARNGPRCFTRPVQPGDFDAQNHPRGREEG